MPNVESSPCGINSLDEHFLPCAYQSKLFVILQWAEGSCRTEMMIWRRDAHSRNRCEFAETKGFFV